MDRLERFQTETNREIAEGKEKEINKEDRELGNEQTLAGTMIQSNREFSELILTYLS